MDFSENMEKLSKLDLLRFASMCPLQNLTQIITPQMAKLGPDHNTTTYIYIDIHIYVVKLLSGPSLAFLIVIIWSK